MPDNDNDMDMGLVTGNEVTIDRDGDAPVRMLQCKVSEDEDVQTIELYRGHGVDECPVSDFATAIILKIGNYSVAIAIDDGILSDVSEGEKELYSITPATNTKSAYLKLCVDGSIEINGATDFAVAYTDLKSAFDTLVTDFNNLVTAYNDHIHVTTATVGIGPPGTIAVTTSTGTPTTADMTSSKVDTVKLP